MSTQKQQFTVHCDEDICSGELRLLKRNPPAECGRRAEVAADLGSALAIQVGVQIPCRHFEGRDAKTARLGGLCIHGSERPIRISRGLCLRSKDKSISLRFYYDEIVW